MTTYRTIIIDYLYDVSDHIVLNQREEALTLLATVRELLRKEEEDK